ncbi:FAD-binding protein [bacterium]|nr:FAD-binding protein [bacterium]
MSVVVPPACVEHQRLISASTYYGIGGTAKYFAQPRSLSDVQQCLNWALHHRLPVAVLGCGSNLLFADGEFGGLVICLSGMTKMHL